MIIVTKNEAKIDTPETAQECSAAFDSKKKENDVDVLPDIPCDVTDQESDITEDAKVADNVEVMDSNNIPVTVDDEIHTEAKSKHAEGRQGKKISRSLQPIGDGTSPVAKRLRRHSSNEIQPNPNHAFTMKSEIKVIEPQEEIASDIVEPINEDCQDKNQTKIEEFSQDSEESSSKPTASLVEEPTQEKQPQKEQSQKEKPQKEQPQKEQPQLTLITSIQDSIPKVVEESIPQPAEANSCHKCGKTYAPRAARFLKDHINKCKGISSNRSEQLSDDLEPKDIIETSIIEKDIGEEAFYDLLPSNRQRRQSAKKRKSSSSQEMGKSIGKSNY